MVPLAEPGGFEVKQQEVSECIAFMHILERDHPDIYLAMIHVPNEGKRSYAQGKKLKKMGLKAGVADFILPVSKAGYNILVMEYKTLLPRGRLSKEQQIWLRYMNTLGNCAMVVYGVDEALEGVKAYWFENKSILLAYME